MRCGLALTLAVGLFVPLATAAPLDGRDPIDDIFYHFMPISWRDSDNDPNRFGDFNGMTASLDYLEDLGVTAVWMNPVFISPAYHGYQHGPGDVLNPWFGTETEFLNFIAAAHARGIKVFVDFVVYGISHDTIWFQDAYNDPWSQYDDWLAFNNFWNTDYQGGVYTSWNGNSVGFIHWDLRHAGPTNLVTQWAQHWLDPDGDGDPSDGLDGYRLDHVWNQYPYGEDGWGYNIDWWQAWNANLETVNPDVFIFAEQADWGSTGADLLSAFDAAFTKPFEGAARTALRDEYAAPLYGSMAATLNALPDGKLFLTTISNHDIARVATDIGDSLAKGRAAAAVLLTQPLPPVIYYGAEIGMRGGKTGCPGDATDIGMREPFKWNAVAGPPMTNYHRLNSCAVSAQFSYDFDGRSVAEQLNVPGSLLEEYRTLIAARKDHDALRRGSYHAIPASDGAVWAFLRHLVDGQTLLVAINVSGNVVNTAMNLENTTIPAGTTTPTDVLTGQMLTPLTAANQDAYPLTLPAYGYRILAVDVEPLGPQPLQIDGAHIPIDLGPPALVATQDNPTGMGDNVNELNQLFVLPENDALVIGLSGNLDINGTGLALFFDSTAGGQPVLETASIDAFGAIPNLDGLTFDAGFSPDYVLYVNAWSGTVYVDLFVLDEAGGGTKRYVGQGVVDSLSGALTPGDNPNGMEVALYNANDAGVTDVDAAAAGTASSGFEMIVPLADIGLAAPTGTIKLLAVLSYGDGFLGNQFLPGLGGPYGTLGFTPVDLNLIPGQQHATIALGRLPGDWNGDGLVNALDGAEFGYCMSGPGFDALGPGCTFFDYTSDQDVDLHDLANLLIDVND